MGDGGTDASYDSDASEQRVDSIFQARRHYIFSAVNSKGSRHHTVQQSSIRLFVHILCKTIYSNAAQGIE